MVIVFGCGRSGTNLVLEMLRGNPYFVASEPPEDKLVFYRKGYPENYLTKCDTIYCNWSLFSQYMNTISHCRIVWTVRDPRDMALSKIYRGYGRADDATLNGCLGDLFYMYGFYRMANDRFGDRIYTVKMENVITDIESISKDVCGWYGIEHHPDMLTPHLRMRHKGKRERYKSLDRFQIGLWKRYDEIYDGFFRNKREMGETLFNSLKPLVEYFGYG